MRVCLVALNAYPAVNPAAGRAIGGLETGAWTLAKALAALGDLEVLLVVRHTRSLDRDAVNEVKLLPIVDHFRDVRLSVSKCLSTSGPLRIQRFSPQLLWQLPLLAATRPFRDRRPIADRLAEQIAAANPDVCVAFGNGADPAAVVRIARKLSRPSLVWLQSNADLDGRFFLDENFVNPYGESSAPCRYLLENANGLICQTRWQQERLRSLTNREAIRLCTPIDLQAWRITRDERRRGRHVLWIGRFDRFHKRPLLCLELARRCSEIPFVMVANRGEPRVAAEVRRHLPDNVQLVDYIPRDRMRATFAEARVFLSTGSAEYEGFPNVFLEAAATGTPTLSWEDFDSFLADSGGGRCVGGDFERATSELRLLWNSSEEWQRHSQAGRRWVEQHHAASRVAVDFRALLDRVLSSRSARGSRPSGRSTA